MARTHARAFIGWGPDRRWVWSEPEQGILVLGPPRRGKTSCIVLPTILAAPGAVVVTSTKPDVAAHTASERRASGALWHFTPSGLGDAPPGTQPIYWSPVEAAKTWDDALLVTRAMTFASPAAVSGSEGCFWIERAGALLAPLLHAAAAQHLSIGDVMGWLLHSELEAPAEALERNGATWAANVLLSVARSAERERSSVFSTAINVLSAYFADAARDVGEADRIAECAFRPQDFVRSHDTVYITAPAHKQALCAPLITGLLHQIRLAAYERARRASAGLEEEGPDCLFALDECANIAPIQDMAALVSEAGGQGLVVMAVLQDLSQARARWGRDVASGFLSVFGEKVILPGIADRSTLEAVSVALGEHVEWVPSAGETIGTTGAMPHRGGSWTYRPNFTPGEVSGVPRHHALHVTGSEAAVVKLVPWHDVSSTSFTSTRGGGPSGGASTGSASGTAGRTPASTTRRVTSRVRRRSR